MRALALHTHTLTHTHTWLALSYDALKIEAYSWADNPLLYSLSPPSSFFLLSLPFFSCLLAWRAH